MKKKTISCKKYSLEIKSEARNNDSDCIIDSTFTNIIRLFILPFKNGDNDPTKNSFDKYYIPIFEIKFLFKRR